jgi:ribosomal protein S18 acetylase RimI-like enzyme
MSAPLANFDEIVYSVLDPSRAAEACQVETTAFLNEPASSYLGEDLEGWSRFAKYFEKECAENGLSIVAVDQASGKVAGVMWNRDFSAPVDEELFQSSGPIIGSLVQVLKAVDEKFVQANPELARGEVVDLWMLAVHPDFRGKQIAARLVQLSLEHLKSQGFKTAVIETTGHYSYRSAVKAGFKQVHEVLYSTFQTKEGQYPWEHMQGEHDRMRFLQQSLQ